jgi:V/A-type H+-transporting ATPase subunit E
MSTDGVQRIIAEIERSAEASASAALAEARTKADAMLADARREAEAQAQAIVARGEQEAQRESQRILAEARIKARRARVKAQEDVVQQAFARARDTLQALAETGRAEGFEYAQVLEDLIVQSVISSGAGALDVLVCARDAEAVSAGMLERVSRRLAAQSGAQISVQRSPEAIACSGGVVVRSADGTVRVENTFEARIERFRDAIRTRVAQELFPRES